MPDRGGVQLIYQNLRCFDHYDDNSNTEFRVLFGEMTEGENLSIF